MNRVAAVRAVASDENIALSFLKFCGTQGMQNLRLNNEVKDFAAADTAKMAMVGRVAVKALLISADVDRADQLGFQQNVQRIVDRRAGKHRIFFGKRVINRIRRRMGEVL